jgi:hypothetical protein
MKSGKNWFCHLILKHRSRIQVIERDLSLQDRPGAEKGSAKARQGGGPLDMPIQEPQQT